MSRLTRDRTAEPVSRDQIFRRERGQGNIHFSCLTDHEQDWQPYPVDTYSCYMCDHTYIHNIGNVSDFISRSSDVVVYCGVEQVRCWRDIWGVGCWVKAHILLSHHKSTPHRKNATIAIEGHKIYQVLVIRGYTASI